MLIIYKKTGDLLLCKKGCQIKIRILNTKNKHARLLLNSIKINAWNKI